MKSHQKVLVRTASNSIVVGYKNFDSISSTLRVYSSPSNQSEVLDSRYIVSFNPISHLRYMLLDYLLGRFQEFLEKIRVFNYVNSRVKQLKFRLPILAVVAGITLVVIAVACLKLATTLLRAVSIPFVLTFVYGKAVQDRNRLVLHLGSIQSGTESHFDTRSFSPAELEKKNGHMEDLRNKIAESNVQIAELRKDIIAIVVPVICAIVPLIYTQASNGDIERKIKELQSSVTSIESQSLRSSIPLSIDHPPK